MRENRVFWRVCHRRLSLSFSAAKKCDNPFCDEAGFTTIGMVLAILITLALIFSAGQVYKLNAASSEVQNVADVCALAAENEVAKFMVVVRVCDAIVLSLSLTALITTGLGVVALCCPAASSAGDALLKAGKDIVQARDKFAKQAATTLNNLQQLLPFLAISQAALVAEANNAGPSRYVALALLSPMQGEPIEVEADESVNQIQEEASCEACVIKESAQKAEDAALHIESIKQEAFEHDCGANPSYCMYERASTLASVAGAENPLYTNIDAWSFSVAYQRAKTYYAHRFANETPKGTSVEEQARSALRKNFYAYAGKKIAEGYVKEGETTFEAEFPQLPKDTEEMRKSTLYTEEVYPCTQNEEGQLVMHAYSGCPNAVNVVSYGSIAQMEVDGYPVCEICKFRASDLGKVGAASSSIDNGFEYHYNIVATAAEEYEKSCSEFNPLAQEVKDRVSTTFEEIDKALKSVSNKRICAHPPGSFGVIVLVSNVGKIDVADTFANSFLKGGDTLGTRIALSAATLVADSSPEGEDVLSSLFDEVNEEFAGVVVIPAIIVDCWSKVLGAYAHGQSALDDALSSVLDTPPLQGASGLGSWASEKLQDVIHATGLQPAELSVLKPVLVNTAHVAGASEDVFSARFLSIKEQVIAHPQLFDDPLSSIVDMFKTGVAEHFVSGHTKTDIASIELFRGEKTPTILKVALPPELANGFSDKSDK